MNWMVFDIITRIELFLAVLLLWGYELLMFKRNIKKTQKYHKPKLYKPVKRTCKVFDVVEKDDGNFELIERIL